MPSNPDNPQRPMRDPQSRPTTHTENGGKSDTTTRTDRPVQPEKGGKPTRRVVDALTELRRRLVDPVPMPEITFQPRRALVGAGGPDVLIMRASISGAGMDGLSDEAQAEFEAERKRANDELARQRAADEKAERDRLARLAEKNAKKDKK